MRRSGAARIYADGITWERDEWERAQRLAVAISGPDVQLIDQLVRHCEDGRRRGRPDVVSGYGWDEEERYQQLVRDLYERAGAATAAQDDPRTVPLTVAEIRQIERLRQQIQYFTGYYMRSRDPMLDQADDFLNKLHFLAGHARAIGTRGGSRSSAQGDRRRPGGRSRTAARNCQKAGTPAPDGYEPTARRQGLRVVLRPDAAEPGIARRAARAAVLAARPPGGHVPALSGGAPVGSQPHLLPVTAAAGACRALRCGAGGVAGLPAPRACPVVLHERSPSSPGCWPRGLA